MNNLSALWQAVKCWLTSPISHITTDRNFLLRRIWLKEFQYSFWVWEYVRLNKSHFISWMYQYWSNQFFVKTVCRSNVKQNYDETLVSMPLTLRYRHTCDLVKDNKNVISYWPNIRTISKIIYCLVNEKNQIHEPIIFWWHNFIRLLQYIFLLYVPFSTHTIPILIIFALDRIRNIYSIPMFYTRIWNIISQVMKTNISNHQLDVYFLG